MFNPTHQASESTPQRVSSSGQVGYKEGTGQFNLSPENCHLVFETRLEALSRFFEDPKALAKSLSSPCVNNWLRRICFKKFQCVLRSDDVQLR